jgi:uncharacterized membrane protein YidH (DUF202 family)
MSNPPEPSTADDVEDRDPGLARERTDLAWTRTAISFAALGAAIMRTNALTGALVMLTGAAVWGLGQLSARETQPTTRRRRLGHRRTVQLITAATTLMSAIALTLTLLAPEHGTSDDIPNRQAKPAGEGQGPGGETLNRWTSCAFPGVTLTLPWKLAPRARVATPVGVTSS